MSRMKILHPAVQCFEIFECKQSCDMPLEQYFFADGINRYDPDRRVGNLERDGGNSGTGTDVQDAFPTSQTGCKDK